MRINNNIMALNTYNNLTRTAGAQGKSMEKLSSGLRINRAGDDAAGLAISEKMRAQIKGLGQASRNSQDGISLIQTAEGALSETQSILQRMRELAVQSANDTNVSEDRSAIQNEIDQLGQEIDRIGDTTEFNTRKLLNGGAGIQGDVATATLTDAAVTIVGGTADTKVVNGDTLTFNTVTKATKATAEFAIAEDADLVGGSFVLNGTTITFANGANSAADQANLVAAINNVSDSTGVIAEDTATGVKLSTSATGANAKIELSGWDVVADDGANTQVSINGAAAADSAATVTATGSNAAYTVLGGAAATNATVTSSGDILTVHGGDYDGLQLKVVADSGANVTTVTVKSNGTLSMQIGANEGQDMSVSLTDMRAKALGVDNIDISTATAAKASITTINDAITNVSTERAKLGAIQNRLEHTINNLNTSSENLTAAESRVRDVDMASEMMNYTKTNILQQAAQAMLAQANQAPQGVLQLLR